MKMPLISRFHIVTDCVWSTTCRSVTVQVYVPAVSELAVTAVPPEVTMHKYKDRLRRL